METSKLFATCVESESNGKEIFNAASLEEAYKVYYRVCNNRPFEFVSITVNFKVLATRLRDGRFF